MISGKVQAACGSSPAPASAWVDRRSRTASSAVSCVSGKCPAVKESKTSQQQKTKPASQPGKVSEETLTGEGLVQVLRFEQRTIPLQVRGLVARFERLLQLGASVDGRLQLAILGGNRLLVLLLEPEELRPVGLRRLGGPLLQALHLGLESALVVGQLGALLAGFGKRLLGLRRLGGLRLQLLPLGSKPIGVGNRRITPLAGFVQPGSQVRHLGRDGCAAKDVKSGQRQEKKRQNYLKIRPNY